MVRLLILIFVGAFLIDECCSNNVSWDYLMFAQVWPGAVCRVANEMEIPFSRKRQNGTCLVPSNVNSWTVHGLWPSRFVGPEGPSFCPGEQRHFNVSNLDPILNTLEVRWPNLLPEQTVSSLWYFTLRLVALDDIVVSKGRFCRKHEWTKHGACAVDLPALDGELLYFTTGLNFNDKFNLLNALSAASVVPTESKSYKLDQIVTALKPILPKVEFMVHCLRSKEEQKWFLSDVRICLNKQFGLIDCSKKLDISDYYKYNVESVPTPQPCPHGQAIFFIPMFPEFNFHNSIEL